MAKLAAVNAMVDARLLRAMRSWRCHAERKRDIETMHDRADEHREAIYKRRRDSRRSSIHLDGGGYREGDGEGTGDVVVLPEMPRWQQRGSGLQNPIADCLVMLRKENRRCLRQ